MSDFINYIISNIITGLFAFGGGVSFLPFFQTYYLDKFNLIDSTRFYELFGYASAMPGPIAPLFAGVVGYELFGVFGLIFGILSFIIPTMILTAFAYKYLEKYQSHPILENISKLIIPVIVVVMLNVVVTVFNTLPDIEFDFKIIHYGLLIIIPAVLMLRFKMNIFTVIVVNVLYVFLVVY